MSIRRQRVVVTGGAGFIGSHLVERLAGRSHVTVIDDLSTGRLENLRPAGDVELVIADITDRASIEGAVRSADVVHHLATSCLRTSIGDPLASLRVNALGTLNVLLAALSGNVKRFVYVSSSEVYGTAERVPMDEEHPLRGRTPYAAGKLAGEAYVMSFARTYGLPVTVVRPFNTYGPRAHVEGSAGEVIPKFVARCLAGLPLHVFGTGEQTRDFTWVGDTARGIELAAESPEMVGEVVNIARGVEISVLELAEHVQRVVGSRVPVVRDGGRPGDVDRHLAATDKARQLLDFTAEVDFEEGLERYVDAVRAQPGTPAEWLARETVVNWSPALTRE